VAQVGRLAAFVVGLCFLSGTMSGLARAEGTPSDIQGSSGPPAASAQTPPVPPVVASCDKPTSPRPSALSPVSVSVNPSTAWQPRGGEVLIAVKGDPAKFTGLSFLACFGWSNAQAKDYFSADNLKSVFRTEAFVTVRPSDQTGILNLGVIVPPLEWAPTGLYSRWFRGDRSSGFGLVPVADMRVIAYTKDGVVFDEVRPIGITSVFFALLVAAGTLIAAVKGLHRLTVGPQPRPTLQTRRQQLIGWLKTCISLSWALELVQRSDGRASLSAFQILLWSLIVAVSAMYVMALSGNLINLTPGTLTLLGIAGAAGLLAAFNDPSTTPVKKGATPAATPTPTPTPIPAGATPAVPQWRDLIVDPATGTPDISRTQMLLFTVVSAAFVVVQVFNYYVIPDIPAGYQILIGISNGLYVGRKFTPPST
jgi:hypothetical protein